MFEQISALLRKSESGKGFLSHQRAFLQAIDTFLRRPALVTQNAPHARDATDLKRVMLIVVASLMPCLLFGIYNTGRNAYLSVGVFDASLGAAFIEGAIHVLPLVLISYLVGGFCEMIFAQVRKHEIAEGFLVTGLLYPLVCPASIPWWMFALGVVFGVVIGKEVFGGTGHNVFNPALVARAFLFFAYPAKISGDVWVKTPYTRLDDGSLVANAYTSIPLSQIEAFILGTNQAIDGFSGASPLGMVASSKPGVLALEPLQSTYSSWELFLGFIPGSIGETSTLLCLLGAFILIVTKVGSWRVMAGVFAGGAVTSLLFNLLSGPHSLPMFMVSPLDHLMMGGFAFGAIFMATDPVSGPLHNRAKLIYGFFIGMLCILIRTINPAYPEGMMLAILFMNIFAALIDHYVLKRIVKMRNVRAQV